MLKEQITQYLRPEDRKDTEYGRITNREWLHLEKQRMAGMGMIYFVGRNTKTGLIALFSARQKGDK